MIEITKFITKKAKSKRVTRITFNVTQRYFREHLRQMKILVEKSEKNWINIGQMRYATTSSFSEAVDLIIQYLMNIIPQMITTAITQTIWTFQSVSGTFDVQKNRRLGEKISFKCSLLYSYGIVDETQRGGERSYIAFKILPSVNQKNDDLCNSFRLFLTSSRRYSTFFHTLEIWKSNSDWKCLITLSEYISELFTANMENIALKDQNKDSDGEDDVPLSDVKNYDIKTCIINHSQPFHIGRSGSFFIWRKLVISENGRRWDFSLRWWYNLASSAANLPSHNPLSSTWW